MVCIQHFEITGQNHYWAFVIPTYIMLDGEQYWCPSRSMTFETLRECIDGAFRIKAEKARLDSAFKDLEVILVVDDERIVIDDTDDTAKVSAILTYGP